MLCFLQVLIYRAKAVVTLFPRFRSRSSAGPATPLTHYTCFGSVYPPPPAQTDLEGAVQHHNQNEQHVDIGGESLGYRAHISFDRREGRAAQLRSRSSGTC